MKWSKQEGLVAARGTDCIVGILNPGSHIGDTIMMIVLLMLLLLLLLFNLFDELFDQK